MMAPPKGGAITKALACAAKAPRDHNAAKHDEVEKKLRTLKAVEKDLLPVDDHTQVQKQIGECKSEIAAWEKAQWLEKLGGEGYQILPSDPFQWRNKDGLPLLAPFSLESNVCQITEDGLGEHFPEPVKELYADVVKTLHAPFDRKDSVTFWLCICLAPLTTFISAWLFFKPWTVSDASDRIGAILGVCLFSIIGGLFIGGMIWSGVNEFRRNKFVAIEAQFSGIIPTEIKEEIEKAKKSGCFKEVFILAETPEWKVRLINRPEPVPIPTVDPLVIGYDGERFLMVKAFDMTKLEEHIAMNYATTTEGGPA